MTVIHERIVPNGRKTPLERRATHAAPEPAKTPALVSYARWTAVAITGFILVTSFMLSFATLSDLAHRAGYPTRLAWLWPLTVDGTIVQATMAIVALAAYRGQGRNRQFFWAVLASAAAVSVGGNILHAVIGTMPPILAAAISCVAPLSLLATTHGLAVLSRFRPEEA